MTRRRSTCREPWLLGVARVIVSALAWMAFVMIPGGALMLLGVRR